MTDQLERARNAFDRQAWSDAFDELSVLHRDELLEVEDVERLAIAAYLVGKDDDSGDAWMHAHQEWLSRGEGSRAASCAFWQALALLFRGDLAPAQGWVARGRRTLEEVKHDSVAQAWLLMLDALPVLFEGDAATASRSLTEAGEIAERFSDPDATTFARLGRGMCLILQGSTAEGMALLDEVMIAVTTDELSPIITGITYCQVIDLCQQVFDLRRAREWTEALSRWCDSQPDLVPFRGNCLVHRCEIFRLHGEWLAAHDEAERACDMLSGPPTWDSLGWAYYQLGEIQRLKGEFAQAEDSYRKASLAGRDPEPGMSLLRMAQGRVEAALAATRRVLEEVEDPASRSKVLPAHIEIALKSEDLETARWAADELTQIASDLGAPYLRALATHALGAVLLNEGDPSGALMELRHALGSWRDLDAPYEAARVRVLIGLACRGLGDEGSAELEFEAAREVFEGLGAVVDLEDLAFHSGTSLSSESPLSTREMEVLVLVAAGKSNRVIADELFISDKTVARHLSNIFLKLGLSSRAEATAYAFQHGLVR